MPSPQPIIVRTYTGSQTSATTWFRNDAAELAKQGYYPTSQNWVPGAYGCGSFLIALLLCLLLIGILIFIYMLIVKPAGTLSVTYEYRAPAIVASEKTCPKCAETVKAAAVVCRFCGHEFETVRSEPLEAAAGATPPGISAALDPYATAKLGQAVLREKLAELSTYSLVEIIRAYEMDDGGHAQKWSKSTLVRFIEQKAAKQPT
jgi:hypothetical protein